MTSDNFIVTTLAEAYDLYCRHLESINPKAIRSIQTALVRYTLPGYGLPSGAKKDAAVQFMTNIPLEQFKNALNIQEQVYASLGTECSPSAKRNYRYELKKMLDWCAKQLWQESTTLDNSKEKYAPRIKSGRSEDVVRTTKLKRLPSYGLLPNEVSENLLHQLDEFAAFLASPSVYKRQDPPVKQITACQDVKNVKRILGWIFHYCNAAEVPLSAISLSSMDDIHLAYKYCEFCRNEREVHPSYEAIMLKSWLNVLKFLYYKSSQVKMYRDIPIIEEIRELFNKTVQRANATPSAIDESVKWLSWEEFLNCVQKLKQECATRDSTGKKRPDTAIAHSYLRYLVFAILSHFPDRQRTIRELEVGRTLIKRDDKWFIEQTADDFKTGKIYCKNGKKRVVELPQEIYPELEEWLGKWRAFLKPKHNYVFSQKNGEPFNSSNLASLFAYTAYRITGKATTPHLVRDMIVTHLKQSGASSQVMESLAELMAHSPDMQRRSYDRRTQQEKVAPALEALRSLNAGILS